MEVEADKDVSRITTVILILSILFFALSLSQPCFCTESSCINSLQAVLTGWAGLYLGWPMLIWLANLCIVVSWVIFKKFPALALVLSLLALSASISFLYVKEIYNLNDEWKSTIISVKSGYWYWLVSILVMAAGIGVKFIFAANPLITKINYGITLALSVFATAFFIILGSNTPKELTITLGGGCVETYHFHGNLDTTDVNYKILKQKSGLCLCKVYAAYKDTVIGNLILMAYRKYGCRNIKYCSRGKAYPNVDSIVKYGTKIFSVEHTN